MRYFFFVCQADGASEAMFLHRLASDGDAAIIAFMMLGDYPDCDHINVWHGERFVLTRRRTSGPHFGPAALH